MVADGFTITRAIQSRSWPASSANLEYAAVWGTRVHLDSAVPRVADDVSVRAISTLLEAQGRATGMPARLKENAGIAYLGAKVYGMGFVLDPSEAEEWITADARNAEVLFPFLNGEDLNSRPDCSPSRWVIDFNDRTEAEAAKYELPFARALERVKPERAKLLGRNSSGDDRAKNWWKFGRRTPALSRAIADLSEAFAITRVSKTVMPVRVPTDLVFSDSLITFASADYSDQAHVLAIALVSKTVMPVRVPAAQVFSHALGVFVTDHFGDQAVLSSSLHQLWAITYGSGMRNDPRYTPSDVFETFPRPPSSETLNTIGRTLEEKRREIMLGRELGLTRLYNLVNDPALARSTDLDIARIREIHVELDRAVLHAYGWGDLPLQHGFHEFRKMVRWTVAPASRVEILDRLLEENHRRARTEQPSNRAERSRMGAEQGGTLFD